MGLAYFVVLDSEKVEFDSFVNGKNIARAFSALTAFCKKHQLKTIEDFHSQDASAFLEDFGDIEIPEQTIHWFSAQEGIDWARTLIEKLKLENPNFDVQAVIDDLEEYLAVFQHCKQAHVQWRLALDF